MIIDIVMPIGHWSRHLTSALESIHNQPRNFRLAIMDASHDPRVKADIASVGLKPDIYRDGKDNGQADAIAKAWLSMDGDVVTWLNADDMLLPNVLRNVENLFLSDPETDVFYANSSISDDNGMIIGLHPEVQPHSDILLRSNIISQPSCFVRRTAMESVGGLNPELEFTMDWDLWVRLHNAGKSIKFVNEIWSNVTWEPATKTASFSRQRYREIFALIRRNSSFYVSAKSIFGFMQHHKSTYKDARISLSTPINKLVNFSILNLTATQQKSIELHFDNIDAAVKCNISGAEVEISEKSIRANFDRAIEPGESVQISVCADQKSSAKLMSTNWQK
ncbi:MAG: glycosyltransferase [Hyphomonadaceae bacterium]|nr:glycosyltransferase [Hyphomonadaceae bacterium]